MTETLQRFTCEIEIAWADCDPAGIVFYPHFFRFMDIAFQRLLATKGTGQIDLQTRFGVVGTPIVEAKAAFRSPGRPGELLVVSVTGPRWKVRSFQVDYAGAVGQRTVFEGHEVRLFASADTTGRLVANPVPENFKSLFT